MPPTTAPAINAQLPTPRNETSNPTKEPMPAPTITSMTRLNMSKLQYSAAGQPALFVQAPNFTPSLTPQIATVSLSFHAFAAHHTAEFRSIAHWAPRWSISAAGTCRCSIPGIIEEHNAVRNAVGVFDVSHMGEIEICGPEAGNLPNS